MLNTQQMLKLDIKKLPSTVKQAPPQPHPFCSLQNPNSYFKALTETLQLWTKVQRSFFSWNVTVWSLVQNQTFATWRLLLFLKQVPGIFCLDGGRGVFKRLLWRTATSAKRRIQPHFRKSKMSSIASCLHLKACWKEPQGSRASSTAWSSPAKAEQCQHRCFNVHNIYKPDTCRQFIWNF